MAPPSCCTLRMYRFGNTMMQFVQNTIRRYYLKFSRKKIVFHLVFSEYVLILSFFVVFTIAFKTTFVTAEDAFSMCFSICCLRFYKPELLRMNRYTYENWLIYHCSKNKPILLSLNRTVMTIMPWRNSLWLSEWTYTEVNSEIWARDLKTCNFICFLAVKWLGMGRNIYSSAGKI